MSLSSEVSFEDEGEWRQLLYQTKNMLSNNISFHFNGEKNCFSCEWPEQQALASTVSQVSLSSSLFCPVSQPGEQPVQATALTKC